MSTDDSPDDPLSRLLAAAAPAPRDSASVRREVADLSTVVAAQSHPRPRRSVRITIGVLIGILALGGASTAAAGTIGQALKPDWRGSPDRVFVITLDSGVECHIRTSVLPADESIPPDDPQVVAGQQILKDLDLDKLDIVVDPNDASGPGPDIPAENRPDPQLLAITSAISTTIFDGLVDRGVYDLADPSRVSVASATACGTEKPQ